MSTVQETIDVDVPVHTAYNQWTQFERFPEFMDGVERVEQRTDRLTYWVTRIGGVSREFEAAIVEQEPDRRIAWQSVEGPRQRGTVLFEPLSGVQTRLTLRMEYEPDGVAEQVGDLLGVVERRVRGDLERFKEFIEAEGVETGAWRGEIHEGAPTVPAEGPYGEAVIITDPAADTPATGIDPVDPWSPRTSPHAHRP